MNKKIFVTGASGYVGAKVYLDLSQKYTVQGTYHSNKLFPELVNVDLTDKFQITDSLERFSPDIIIHIAADAHTKTCESNPEYAHKINVVSTEYIVEYAKSRNIPVIYVSTFACFNPTNVYGKTKKQAEELISTLKSYLIIRASLVIGFSPNTSSENFFNQIVESIKQEKEIEADTSWKFEFTYLEDLSKLVLQYIEKDLPNFVIPFISDGVVSRFDIAEKAAKPYGITVNSIDQNRNIPIQEFDKSIYSQIDFKRMNSDECIEDIKTKIAELLPIKK